MYFSLNSKIFLYRVEDMSSIAKAINIREISIDNNPVSLGGDCTSFLVSYLPQLVNLNNMQVTEQVKKAAMAWRRNKESSDITFMDLTSDVSLNVRREEVISNARTNWELLRSQTKCLSAKTSASSLISNAKNLKPDNDFILTSLVPPENKFIGNKLKSKLNANLVTKVPVLPEKKINFVRTPSQDTENSQNTSSSNNSSNNEFFRLPPILVPIINKMEGKCEITQDSGIKLSSSLSSIGPNVDSSVGSLMSSSQESSSSGNDSSSSEENLSEDEIVQKDKTEDIKENQIK